MNIVPGESKQEDTNRIRITTGGAQESSFDVGGEVTAIYHDGVELLARLNKLESHSTQQDKLLCEIQLVQKTNVRNHETNMVNNAKRRLAERGFAIFALIALLVITSLGGFGIDMARECITYLKSTAEKVDSLLAMGSSLEQAMGVKVGDAVTVSASLDSELLKRLENVGCATHPRIQGRVLAKNGNEYIICHVLDDGSKILKARIATSPRQVLPDYTVELGGYSQR